MSCKLGVDHILIKNHDFNLVKIPFLDYLLVYNYSEDIDEK